MKHVLFVCALFCGMTTASAQSAYFKQSLQLGVGFASTLGYAGNYKSTPAVSLSYEHMLPFQTGPGRIGVGAIVAFQSEKYDGGIAGYESKWNNSLFALRGTWHLEKYLPENLDVYGAAQLGLRFEKNKFKLSGETAERTDKNTRVHAGLLVGARYFFHRNFAAFSEVGYDLAVIKVGIAARF
ncbi:hypothetical protein EGT74_19730 [Chitinophaga lutea]|uniref:Outer membrane protein beta-barrel domain-containing protein n=1 Tax=Chitinophaga lutea TaxID=2488634 RepID=A0A3N4PKM6_9BACT|nr:outer membrane beta-barrel protein [Chitinophaga lutea]RPE09233.1 hypothetical protein EGT74_19730 [Chitinophaga lutea]